MTKILYTALATLLVANSWAQRPPVNPPTMETPGNVIAPNGYWQQRVSYKMDIDFDHKNHQFNGTQALVYTNNSPDQLDRVYYHLYYNAFQPNSMMDVRSRTIEDPDGRVEDRISHLNKKEIGYHNITSLTMNDVPVKYEVVGTILEVDLPKAIAPGESVTFNMTFDSQVPVQIRRTGRDNMEGVDYSMTQWYPKMAEYDKEGWHANPYVGREFHGVWGDFDVKINIASNYVLGGTGVVQNPNEVGHGYETEPVAPKSDDMIEWHFKAENVHDFAWAADPDFKHDIARLNNGTKLHFLYQTDTLAENWEKLQPYAVKCFEYINQHFGEYPYEQYSVIQGGDGGMEYPMATLITSHGSLAGLISVTVHESIHSWYQGMMATNESKYPWMDEGFTTYAQSMAIDYLYDKKQINPVGRSYMGYAMLARSKDQEPLTTHADHYKKNRTYGISVYSKGAVFLHQLSYIIGQDAFDQGMLDYYHQWRFKHPTPDDFKRVMERASGLELDWYFEQFIGTINTIDYAIDGVEKKGKKTLLKLAKKADMPMPLDILITKKDGTVEMQYVPIRILRGEKEHKDYDTVRVHPDWGWTYPTYEIELDIPLSEIKTIEIDPTKRMADLDRANNIYPAPPTKKNDK